jgi:hypothetical protein
MGTRSGTLHGVLSAAVAATVAAMVLLFSPARLGVAGEWVLERLPHNIPAVLVPPAIAAAALLLAAWWTLGQAAHTNRRRLGLALLVVAGGAFALTLGLAGPTGLAEPVCRTLSPVGLGPHIVEAEHIGPYRPNHTFPPGGGEVFADPLAWLRRFNERQEGRPLDAAAAPLFAHPPGVTLGVWAADFVCRNGQRRRSYGPRLLRDLGIPGAAVLFPPRRLATGPELAGVVLLGLGAGFVALTALAVYALAADLGADRRAAVGAAALWLATPGPLLHAPALEQLTPLLTLLVAMCWGRAGLRRSLPYATLTGLVTWLGLFFTLDVIPVIVALALGMVLWVVGRGGAGRSWSLLVAGAAALAAAALAAWLAFGYDTPRALAECARRAAEWRTMSARSYRAWLAWNPVMFVLFFGSGAAALWIAGIWNAASGIRRAGAKPASWIPAAMLVAVLLALWLSGRVRGEAERLSAPWMAFALAVSAAGLGQPQPARRLPRAAWVLLLVCQLALVLALRYRVDVQGADAFAVRYLSTWNIDAARGQSPPRPARVERGLRRPPTATSSRPRAAPSTARPSSQPVRQPE